jgi:hypothetical protein
MIDGEELLPLAIKSSAKGPASSRLFYCLNALLI